MIDINKEIVKELQKTGLKIYNEYFVDSSTPIPCITYREHDNSSYKEGDIIGYSQLSYHIKVWGKDLQTLIQYSKDIESIMRDLGFKRISCNTLWLDGVGQRDLKYTNLALENFNNGGI